MSGLTEASLHEMESILKVVWMVNYLSLHSRRPRVKLDTTVLKFFLKVAIKWLLLTFCCVQISTLLSHHPRNLPLNIPKRHLTIKSFPESPEEEGEKGCKSLSSQGTLKQQGLLSTAEPSQYELRDGCGMHGDAPDWVLELEEVDTCSHP